MKGYGEFREEEARINIYITNEIDHLLFFFKSSREHSPS